MDKLTNYRNRIVELLTFGEIRAKEFRHSKALKDNLLKLLLRPETLLLCLTFGADRRLEFNRYSLLGLLVILNQCIHCAWFTFRHHLRLCTPHSNRYSISAVVMVNRPLKGVADNVLSRP